MLQILSVVIGLLLLIASSAAAGSFTLTSTVDQDAALTWVTQQENTRRAALQPPLPALTPAEYVQFLFTNALESYRAQKQQSDEAQRKTQFDSLPTPVQIRVKNLLLCGKDVCP